MNADQRFEALKLTLPAAPAPMGVYKPFLQVGNMVLVSGHGTLKANLGSLNKIKRVVKVLGMVNSTPDFAEHPYVINGCSELFAQIWGEDNGVGVRSAVGMGSLPGAIPVEIEAQFELM
jgi:enamine deaminase RidA (YjgF/YER057c/UK114 family)